MFAMLRLDNILPVGDTPNNVCVCQIHSNFIEAVNVLSPYTNISKYDEKWTLQTVCQWKKKCCFN